MEEITFDGEPFVFVPPVAAAPPAVMVPVTVPPVTAGGQVRGESVADRPAGGPGARELARDVADRVRRAHAAVLASHAAVQDWMIRRAGGAGLPAAPAGADEPVPALTAGTGRTLHTSHPIPAEAWYTVDGQAPAALVVQAGGQALRALLESVAPPGCDLGSALHPGRVALHWHGDLPVAPAVLDVSATLGEIAPRPWGSRVDYEWRVAAGGRPLATATGTAGFGARTAIGLDGVVPERPWPGREVPRYPAQFRPLAHTRRRQFTPADLEVLGDGGVAEVLGAAFDQQGVNPSLRLPLTAARLVAAVGEIDPEGGRYGQGSLLAGVRTDPDDPNWPYPDPLARLVLAAGEVLQIYALHRGLQLCMVDARFQPWDGPTGVEVLDPGGLAGSLRYWVELTELGLVPRPHLVADIQVSTVDHRPVARLHDVGLLIREKPGVDVSLVASYRLRRAPAGRRNPAGEPALLHELHAAHAADGDLTMLAGPAGDRVTGWARPRLPCGDLRLVDRGMGGELGTDEFVPGRYTPGSVAVTEYDMPPDPWYCRENGTRDAVPNLVYLESTLQSAAMVGAAQGLMVEYPQESFSCRNLEGSATLLSAADPRGRTLRQTTTLTGHTPLPGAMIQRYAYQVTVDGAPLYEGEAAHGYFTPPVLATQQGLDGGGYLPPWLDRQPTRPATRRLDLRDDTRLGRGRLALLHEVDLVVDGGEHGAGYVRWERPVDADDWFMAQHFYRDPVMPGSVGIESLFQSVQGYLWHAGLLAGIQRPRCAPAVGVRLSWKYRGQILAGHRRMRGEVHLCEIRRTGEGLLVLADGSVWRDDLRIYQALNIGVQVTPEASR